MPVPCSRVSVGELAGPHGVAADTCTITEAIHRTTNAAFGVVARRQDRRAATDTAGGLTAQEHGHELSIEIDC